MLRCNLGEARGHEPVDTSARTPAGLIAQLDVALSYMSASDAHLRYNERAVRAVRAALAKDAASELGVLDPRPQWHARSGWRSRFKLITALAMRLRIRLALVARPTT